MVTAAISWWGLTDMDNNVILQDTCWSLNVCLKNTIFICILLSSVAGIEKAPLIVYSIKDPKITLVKKIISKYFHKQRKEKKEKKGYTENTYIFIKLVLNPIQTGAPPPPPAPGQICLYPSRI